MVMKIQLYETRLFDPVTVRRRDLEQQTRMKWKRNHVPDMCSPDQAPRNDWKGRRGGKGVVNPDESQTVSLRFDNFAGYS